MVVQVEFQSLIGGANCVNGGAENHQKTIMPSVPLMGN